MVGIIDYGVGNLFSLRSSLCYIGADVEISSDPDRLRKADHLILPGVGAFADAAEKLRCNGLDGFVREQVRSGVPLMGICLGMQMLFERSYEYGVHDGLGLLSGEVVAMTGLLPQNRKIPHMGWNRLRIVNQQSRLLSQISNEDYVYFVHSYFAQGCEDSLAATTDYDITLTAAVEKENIFGCQFHPEKSGKVGLKILDGFCKV